MIVPRFRIAWVMVAVAIAALDFGAIRPLLGPYANVLDHMRGSLLLLGALPMANVLAVGMLIGHRRPGSRPFLIGFEVLGAMALASFIAVATCFPREVVLTYLNPVLAPIDLIPIQAFVAVVMLGGPQAAFAVIGGFLSRRFKLTITVTRR